ncbi:MAG: energy transducer TonB [Pseudomonadota bacterium]
MNNVGTHKNDNGRLLRAAAVAFGLHLILIFGIGFSMHDSRAASARQIEVTLAMRPQQATPDDARMLAQANQVGPSEANQFEPPPSPPPSASQPQQRPNSTATLTTRSDARRMEQELETLNPEVERLQQEVEELEAELAQQTRDYQETPRTRRITAASTRVAIEAAYLNQWRARLEAVGTRYYPEASVRYGIYGDLRLLVIIRQDGSLEDVRVLDSSGYAVLDEAALKIVRMAAPYPPFSPELRATTDRLEIVRTWQFQENGLSSG